MKVELRLMIPNKNLRNYLCAEVRSSEIPLALAFMDEQELDAKSHTSTCVCLQTSVWFKQNIYIVVNFQNDSRQQTLNHNSVLFFLLLLFPSLLSVLVFSV